MENNKYKKNGKSTIDTLPKLSGSLPGKNGEKKKAEEARSWAEQRLKNQNTSLLWLTKKLKEAGSEYTSVLRNITEIAAETIEVDRVSIWLYDEQKEQIQCEDLFEKSKQQHSSGMIFNAKDYPAYFKAIAEERIVDAHDARIDPRTKEFSKSYLTPLHISSMLDAPLLIGEKLIGVICFEHTAQKRIWTLEEKNFAGSMADAVSLAVETNANMKVQQKLRESEERFHNLWEASFEGIAIHDKTKIIEVNKTLAKMFGYEESELIGMDPFKLVAPQSRDAVIKNINAPTETYYEAIGVKKDGSTFWGELVGRPFKYKEKDLRLVLVRDISQRKKTERELELSLEEIKKLNAELETRVQQRTEEVYDLYNNAPSGYHSLNKDGKIRDINNTELKMLGYERNEMMGRNLTEFLTPEGQNTFKEAFPVFLKQGYIKDLEMPFVRKDKTIMYALINSTALKDTQENIIVFRTNMIDITEKKKLKDTLQESEQKYRNMIEEAGDVIYTTDREGNFTYISPKVTALTGYLTEELIKKHFTDMVVPEWRERVKELYLNQYKNKIAETVYTFPMLTKSGEQKWVEQTVTQLTKDNWITGHQSIARDVTDRVKATEALKESLARIEMIIMSAPSAVVVMDEEGMILNWNFKSESIFGWKEDEIIGKTMHETIMPPKYKDEHIKDLQELLKTGEGPILNKTLELSVIRKDGVEFPIELSISVAKVKGKNLFTSFINDITIRKKTEKTLQEAREKEVAMANSREQLITELKRSNKEIEQFVYISSHDLQEPLLTVTNYVGLFQKKYAENLGEKSDEFMHFITDATSRMQTLINDLLEYSMIGRHNTEMTAIDCSKLVDDVLKDMSLSIEENKADIKVEQLPVINGHSTEIKLLFQNLLSNSIKFRKKDVAPIISITAQEQNENWLFAIKDNGIGIDEKYYPKLFIIFQRLHTREEYPGTGIGLAHCKKIIELHKGKIWVKSEIEKGSTFYFTIPKKLSDKKIESEN